MALNIYYFSFLNFPETVMKRVSFVDIGTNTALLLIADLDQDNNRILPVLHRQSIVRIGKNVDEQKIIDHAALQRLIQCMLDFRETSKTHDALSIMAAGTSALRDAKNRMEIIDEVVRESGIVIKTLSGEEEAAMTFTGAVAGMEDIPERFTVIDIGGGSTEITMGNVDHIEESVSLDMVDVSHRYFSTAPSDVYNGKPFGYIFHSGNCAGMEDIPERFTVIDIGGGSTEITMGNVDHIEESVSLDIGSVRLTERFFTAQPPSEEELHAAKEKIDSTFTSTIEPFFSGREQVFGVAGTLTTIAHLVSGEKEFDPEKVHNYPLRYDQVKQLLEELQSLTVEQITRKGIPEGRADVITMGTLILHQFMRLLGVPEIQVSIQGLRYGLALKELQRLRSGEQ